MVAWKVVPGFPLYKVSDTGIVTGTRGVLKTFISRNRFQVVLNTPTRKQFEIHKLVAQAFVPNPMNYSTVKHINGDTLDNHYTNLAWSGE